MIKNFEICLPIRDCNNFCFFKRNTFFVVKYSFLYYYTYMCIPMFMFSFFNVKLNLINSLNICSKVRQNSGYSTKKLYKQKGTGRSRIGSKKSPLLKGGSTIFICRNKFRD